MAKTTDTSAQKRSHALTVAYATGAMFVILMALLIVRLEAGLDPSIGTASYKTPAVKQRRVVVHNRVIKVIRDEPVQVASAGSPGAGGGGSVAPAASGGSGNYSAPAPAAAPQTSTPAPAPAPAPAPVTKAS